MKKSGHVLINKALTAPHSILPFHLNKNYYPSSLPFNYFYYSSGSGSSVGTERPDEEISRDTDRRVSEEEEMSGLEGSSAEQGMSDGKRDAMADFVENDYYGDTGGDAGGNTGGDATTIKYKPKKMGQQQLNND